MAIPNNGRFTPPARPPVPMQQASPFGTQWRPMPTDYAWLKLSVVNGDTGLPEQLFVLSLQTSAGTFGVSFNRESLERFIEQTKATLTGLTLAPPMPDLSGFGGQG